MEVVGNFEASAVGMPVKVGKTSLGLEKGKGVGSSQRHQTAQWDQLTDYSMDDDRCWFFHVPLPRSWNEVQRTHVHTHLTSPNDALIDIFFPGAS